MIQELFLEVSTAFANFTLLSEWEESFRFLGIKIVNISDLSELLLRFMLNTGVLLLILQGIYLQHSKRRDFYFSYMGVGTTVFLLCYLLNSLNIELGFALGLFAIFGIIRYRTDAIPIKEMTYLFIIIGVSIVNALASKKISYAELLVTNAIVVVGLWILEKYLKLKQEGSLRIIYENISNVHKNNHEKLMQDLRERTGVEIERFEIERIDYLKDIAIITVYFHAECNGFSQSVQSQIDDHDDGN